MRRSSVYVAAVLMLTGATAAGAQQVTIVGCPAAGAVPGCLMIRGADNVTYNITELKNRPDFTKGAVRITGFRTNKTSYCAQGVVLTGISWAYTEQPCR